MAELGWADTTVFMGLGTKNRLAQTAVLCREHLRAHHAAGPGDCTALVLVEEFIREIEGEPADPAKWSQFTDLSRDRAAMLRRVDERFERWLNGED